MRSMTDILRNIIEVCRAQDMQMPLVVCAIGENSTVCVYQFDTEISLLAEHSEAGGLVFPVRLMIGDAAGRGLNAMVAASGDMIQPTWTLTDAEVERVARMMLADPEGSPAVMTSLLDAEIMSRYMAAGMAPLDQATLLDLLFREQERILDRVDELVDDD